MHQQTCLRLVQLRLKKGDKAAVKSYGSAEIYDIAARLRLRDWSLHIVKIIFSLASRAIS